MPDLEAMAVSTCRDLLTAKQLKEICRRRGFVAPKGGKEALAGFVAPRLLEPAGVERAMASLNETWLEVLHLIAMKTGGTELDAVAGIALRGEPRYRIDHRDLFRMTADCLLNRGVVLVEDQPELKRRNSRSRYADLRLHLPAQHGAAVPPFPVATEPLEAGLATKDGQAFFRLVLKAWAGAKAGGAPQRPKGLLARAVAAVELGEKGLCVDGKPVSALLGLRAAIARLWFAGTPAGDGRRKSAGAFLAAAHILHHLPPGRGVATYELDLAVRSLGFEPEEGDVELLCEEGHLAGFLARGGPVGDRCFAGLPEPEGVAEEPPLVCRARKGGVEVDLDRSGLGALTELLRVSRVTTVGGRMFAAPDVVRMGRADDLASLSSLGAAREVSTVFDEAARLVEERKDRVILHEGLVIFRIEDLGLRTLVSHRMAGSVRALGGPYLAALRSGHEKVEKLAAKEGFAVRWIS
jgi:hypothetical protein